MTNEEIMLSWNQECKVERPTHELIIAFARLIAEKQKEIDAEIAETSGGDQYEIAVSIREMTK